MNPCVYILASGKVGTLYIGVTSDISRRIYEHKNGLVKGFTKQHNVKQLVYYEQFDQIADAIIREKQLKEWRRSWKIQLIEQSNPEWHDLSEQMFA